jgi:hypothetical protein
MMGEVINDDDKKTKTVLSPGAINLWITFSLTVTNCFPYYEELSFLATKIKKRDREISKFAV